MSNQIIRPGPNESSVVSTGSATTTETAVAVADPKTSEGPRLLVLKVKPQKKIVWCEDTVDNENMCKKSSKRCCIYHKPKAFGESDSDESDSDIDEAERADAKNGENLSVKPYQRFHA